MAVTLSITVNNQELIDEFVALNSELNTSEDRNLTPQQRLKEMLRKIVTVRLLTRYAQAERATATETAEATIQTEATRLDNLT